MFGSMSTYVIATNEMVGVRSGRSEGLVTRSIVEEGCHGSTDAKVAPQSVRDASAVSSKMPIFTSSDTPSPFLRLTGYVVRSLSSASRRAILTRLLRPNTLNTDQYSHVNFFMVSVDVVLESDKVRKLLSFFVSKW